MILGDERPDIPEELREWAQKLFEIGGLQTITKAAAIAARFVLPAWKDFHESKDPERAIEAAEQWADDPTLENARKAGQRGGLDEVHQLIEDLKHTGSDQVASIHAARSASFAAYSAWLFSGELRKDVMPWALRAGERGLAIAQLATEDSIRSVVAAQLVPRLLEKNEFEPITEDQLV